MSSVLTVTSAARFQDIIDTGKIVICCFYNHKDTDPDLAGYYEGLAEKYKKDKVVTFIRVNVETYKDIADTFHVKVAPTFILFKDGKILERAEGNDLKLLQPMVATLMTQVILATSTDSVGSISNPWLGAPLPRGYQNITDKVELPLCELLNIDPAAGNVRVLFSPTKPGSGSAVTGSNNDKDWVESDTDEQVMLFIPFMATAKVHTLQITSCPGEDDEAARPRLIKLYSNSPHNMGFDEAEDTVATQEIELTEASWKDDTASISLRFVKFQKVNSLVMFVVSAEGGAEKVRLDRLRLIGESGEKREMGRLEKIGDERGE